jgi:hypothetical protein
MYYVNLAFFVVFGIRTQGFVHARQVLYHKAVPPSALCVGACVCMCVMYDAADWTLDLAHTRQALYYLSYAFSP